MNQKKIRVQLPFSVSFLDYPDPEDHCISIYTTGCENNCTHCSNEELKDHSKGKELEYLEFEKRLEEFSRKTNTRKITFIGGEPLYKENIEFVKYFTKKNKSKYDICIYTGYDIEFVKLNNVTGFKYIKCGRFNSAKRQTSLKTDKEIILASTNQEIYDSKYNLLSKGGIYKFE